MLYFSRTNYKELTSIISCLSNNAKKSEHYDLVLIRLDGIGDYVIWHDTLSSYKKKFIEKRVLLICDNSVRSIAEQEPFFSDIISFRRTDAPMILKCLKRIEADLVINTMRERPWFADICSMAITAKEKLAINTTDKKYLFKRIYNNSYSKLINLSNRYSEVLADEEFTQFVIDKNYKYGSHKLRVNVETPALKSPYVVIAFSSSSIKRNWPLERFVEIINVINSKYNIIITGAGDTDSVGADIILKNVINKNRVINLVNKTTIAQIVAIISNSSLVIGNDSSAVHIAAATGVPSVAIVPGAHYGRFLPYPDDIKMNCKPIVVAAKMECFNCDYRCIFNTTPYECINRVSFEMVKNALNEIIE